MYPTFCFYFANLHILWKNVLYIKIFKSMENFKFPAQYSLNGQIGSRSLYAYLWWDFLQK